MTSVPETMSLRDCWRERDPLATTTTTGWGSTTRSRSPSPIADSFRCSPHRSDSDQQLKTWSNDAIDPSELQSRVEFKAINTSRRSITPRSGALVPQLGSTWSSRFLFCLTHCKTIPSLSWNTIHFSWVYFWAMNSERSWFIHTGRIQRTQSQRLGWIMIIWLFNVDLHDKTEGWVGKCRYDFNWSPHHSFLVGFKIDRWLSRPLFRELTPPLCLGSSL